MTARYLLLACVLPVAVGAMVYVSFRDTHMLWYRWFDLVGLAGVVGAWRDVAAPARTWIPGWLLFSGPDGAWVFACTAFYARLWPDGPPWMRWGWVALGTALAVGGELGQVVGLVPGTFDPVDVAAYLAAALAAFTLAARWPRAARLAAATRGPHEHLV